MVQFVDGSVVAQLGTPDMRMPIAYGLSWPKRIVSGADNLDFRHLPAMTFEALNDHGHATRFPGLQLAWQALNATSRHATTVLQCCRRGSQWRRFSINVYALTKFMLLNLATMESVSSRRHPRRFEDLTGFRSTIPSNGCQACSWPPIDSDCTGHD
jgi:1-deoxy-D-xylulose-5-phosphate reductoisomerase